MKHNRGHTLKRILGDIHIGALTYTDDVVLLAENGEDSILSARTVFMI